MVKQIRNEYGLNSPEVLSVMLEIPREKFLRSSYKTKAYMDAPIPIGFGQTMSQPYTVAFMTDLLLNIKNDKQMAKQDRVLEIGTGSGYQAAILSHFFNNVFTLEIVPELAINAKKILKSLGFNNVSVKCISGEWGYPEEAPYDAIMVTAGLGRKVPDALPAQLKIGGVLVAPVGSGNEKIMTRITRKSERKYEKEEFGKFRFVPFV